MYVDRRELPLGGRERRDEGLVGSLEAAGELGDGGALALDEGGGRGGGGRGRGEVVLVDGAFDPGEKLLIDDGDLIAADLVEVAAVKDRVELACDQWRIGSASQPRGGAAQGKE